MANAPGQARGTRGYTLYELLVTLAIATIVIAIGVPSFGTIIARHQQRVEINALFHAIHLARKASLARRYVVTLCPSPDGVRCVPGRDWSNGWLMFVNADRDSPPVIDPGERILQRHRVSDRVRLTANRAAFTLRGVGLRATNGTFVACDRAGRVRPRALVVSYTGRPRAALATPGGEPYACAH